MEGFNFAEAKARARRAVHQVMAVRASYRGLGDSEATDITVRWHNKQEIQGVTGYPDIIEGIERLIFSESELLEKGVTLRSTGVVTVTEPGWGEPELVLEAREPKVGPEEEIWKVSR